MRIQITNRVGPFMVHLLLLVGLLSTSDAFAHDPLREHDSRDHRESRTVVDQAADLARARDLILQFRVTGDDRHLDAAWKIVEPGLAAPAAPVDRLITAAFVAQSRHQFDVAVKLLNRSLALNSRNEQAWLLLASIHLVRGDAQAAKNACRHLNSAPALVLVTCQARVTLIGGTDNRVFDRLVRVLEVAESQSLPADMLAWSYSVAGDVAVDIGDLRNALAMYKRSLELAERTQVRAAMIDVLLLRSEFEAALAAVDAEATALPLVVRRLIAVKQLGRVEEVDEISAVVDHEFEAWIADEDWLHAREMTRFYIDVVERPVLARQLALINIELQREPEDLRLLERTLIAPGS